MPKPEELPRLFTGGPPNWAIAATFPELLQYFAERFAAWVRGVTAPPGGFAVWDWNTDFSRHFMGQFRELFIVPLGAVIQVYERFLAQREAERLAKALVADPPTPLDGAEEVRETPQGPAAPQSAAVLEGDAAIRRPEPEFVFRRNGGGWFIRAFGKQGYFGNLRGFEHIAKLLEAPGKRVPMTHLAGGQCGTTTTADAAEEGLHAEGVPQPMIDEQAQQDIKRELKRLQEEIADAESEGDVVAVQDSRAKLNQLLEQYKDTRKPGGETKNFPTPVDRMRSQITKALNRVYKQLHQAGLKQLADHLRVSISAQGDSFIYSPTPSIPWALGEFRM
ncbi:hypothetical protein JCM17478_30400 [Thermopirellula anaerolimosa]